MQGEVVEKKVEEVTGKKEGTERETGRRGVGVMRKMGSTYCTGA